MRTAFISIAVCCLLMMSVGVVNAQETEKLADGQTTQVQTQSEVTQQQGFQMIERRADEWQWSDRPHMLSFTAGAPSLLVLIPTSGRGSFGAYSIQYEYNVLKWLAVGLRGQYEGYKVSRPDSAIVTAANYPYDVHRVDATLGVHFTYVNREFVQVYSGLAVGTCFVISNSDSRVGFAGSLTPIGVRIGSKHVFGMAEVNLGTASLFSVGVCVRM